MSDTIYTFRHIARIIIEAVTPFAVSSGEGDIVTDSLVLLDANGLPYIPGTSIAGVVRHALGITEKDEENLFGYQKGTKNHGSEVIFSEARLVKSDGKTAVDGMLSKEELDDVFLSHYKELPIRQHVRIAHTGSATDAGKFDEQVVYKGTRFAFDIELVSTDDKKENFHKVLQQIKSPSFRLGGGTRKGFGEFVVRSCKGMTLDLSKKEDLLRYINYDTSLAVPFEGEDIDVSNDSKNIELFDITLTPDDFFLFGSGFGDDEADMSPVKESYVTWETGKGEFVDNGILIPASGLKGALAHRVAYYYNKAHGIFADTQESFEDAQKKENKAVAELFGSSGQAEGSKGISCGKILFSDIVEEQVSDSYDKLVNHVSIDRFTGGAIEGALFTERTTYGKGRNFHTKLIISQGISKESRIALENALDDLCKGQLPLGGGTSRGNGFFTCTITPNFKIEDGKQ